MDCASDPMRTLLDYPHDRSGESGMAGARTRGDKYWQIRAKAGGRRANHGLSPGKR
jgi:hypothetical protein